MENEPATKADIEKLRTDLIEQMRAMQTEMLRAFYSWGRTMELRISALPTLDQRLAVLENRVSELERKDSAA